MDFAHDAMDAPPPPVGGLGNFKGVMLCNRPVGESTLRLEGGDRDQPFRSMIAASYGEQLGLNPCKNYEQHTVKTHGPSAALRRHVRWLKELQAEMRQERAQAEAEEQQHAERKQRVKAFSEKQREGVREMIHTEQDRKALERALDQPGSKAAAAEYGAKSTPAMGEYGGKVAGSGDVPKRKPSAKPMWAMTEQEKDDFEEGEADQLIDFAENLDYDRYVGDFEFRQALDALKDRTGKLQKEQDAFKEALLRDFNARPSGEDASAGNSPRRLEDGLDGVSVLGSEYSAGACRRSRSQDEHARGAGRDDWDSSTSCAEERPVVDRGLKQAAEHVLDSNPQLRAVHSKGSMQRVIERQRERQLAAPEQVYDLLETMRRDGPAVTPVIVASADTQQRLHKQVAPSQLPYLYRCMSI